MMELKKEFVRLALQSEESMSELCRRYGISRKTGYKWIKRYKEKGETGLNAISRRPHESPLKTSLLTEAHIIEVRKKYRSWGGRKIRKWLMENEASVIVPSASTITAIVKRNGYVEKEESEKHQAWKRFEHEKPNALWQADFKGHIGLLDGKRCHPLTVLDDHSRFSLGIEACLDERYSTVKEKFRRIFQCYGLPQRMNVDNGPPWGTSHRKGYTRLTIWLMRLGIAVSFSRIYHPQTNGKIERFHRTLKAEVLKYGQFTNVEEAQKGFDEWRDIYNQERPHEALGMQTPIERYVISSRAFPNDLEPIEYGAEDIVRKVQGRGYLFFRNNAYYVGEGFCGEYVALKMRKDGCYSIYYCAQRIGEIDLHTHQ